MDYPYLLIILSILFIGSFGYLLWYSFLSGSPAQSVSKATSSFSTYSKVTKLAPIGCPQEYRLCDFFITSSAYTVFPGTNLYDYISDKVIPLVIKAGVRVIELDIYADSDNKPIIGLKNDTLGVNYAYNTVPFEACCVSIINNAFNSVSSPVSTDPFVLSLNFHTNINTVINACANILTTTCRGHMLDRTFSYEKVNLAIEPICNLQSKLIIVSGGAMKGTLMEELVNLSWDTSHLRRLTYTQASQPHDYEELVDFNRNNITMVVPDLSSDLTNMNSQILFTYGCQWNMMNYGSIDSAMEVYIGEFQENSCVLKPAALRPLKPKKYKTPKKADPNLSFQPMQKISPIYNITV